MKRIVLWMGLFAGYFEVILAAQSQFDYIRTTNTAATNVIQGKVVMGSSSNVASGTFSVAEGYQTKATGAYSHAEGAQTTASGMASHAEGAGTLAGGYASHASGSAAKATNDYTYVWSDGTSIGSTTTRQYTVYATNGVRLLGGPISGDGAGLTNLNASSISGGSIPAARFPTNGINASSITMGTFSAERLPTSGQWNAGSLMVSNLSMQSVLIAGNVASMTNLLFEGVPLAQIVSNLQRDVYGSKSFVMVTVTTNELTNGLNLLGAYAKAVTMNPSVSNRIAVMVSPGRYNLGSAELKLNASYVDLIGQTTDRDIHYVYGVPSSFSNGVVKQTVDAVRIENLTIQSGSSGAAYFSTVPGSNSILRNCEFKAGIQYTSMSAIECAGRYENCVASGSNSFGKSIASGQFIQCRAGDHSFGGEGNLTTNAVFISCSAGVSSFGQFNTVSDNFNYNTSGQMFAGGSVSVGALILGGVSRTNWQTSAGMTNIAWGSITGNLSGQIDLANALSSKAAKVDLISVSNALLAKVNSGSLALVATSGNYGDLVNAPVLAPIATNANFSNLTVADGVIMMTKVNGLTAQLAEKCSTAQASNFVNKGASSNVLAGKLTVQGAFTAHYVPRQGDLLMGTYTNGLPQ